VTATGPNWIDVANRLPADLRLSGWSGPTLFTSEVRDGRLVALGTFRDELRDHSNSLSLVIGTIRETQGPVATAYAAFCADPSTGRVVLVDLAPPNQVRFVNRGLEQFEASIAAFVSSWPRLAKADDATAASILDEIRAELTAIDAVATSDDDAFWPTSLEVYS